MTFQPLESFIRRLSYGLLRLLVRNKPARLPLNADAVRKILVLRHDRLGDMVVTTPVFELLRERLPQAELHVLASPRNAGLLRRDERINEVIEYDGSWRALLRLRRKARRERYDVALCLVFYKMTSMGIFVNIVCGPSTMKATLRHAARGDLYAVWFNAQITLETEQPMTPLLLELVSQVFGWSYLPSNDLRYLLRGIRLAEESVRRLDIWFEGLLGSFLRGRETTIVFFNLSAGMPFRQWSLERNTEAIFLLRARYPDFFIVLNATATEREQAEKLALLSNAAPCAVLPVSADPLDLCAAIRRTDYVFTPDTAVAHIAAAFGKPVLTLCTRISSGPQWAPFGAPHLEVYPENDPDGTATVESIEPRAAMTAFERLLDSVRGATSPEKRNL